MSYQVYILYSKILNRFYVGQAKDINVRLVQHSCGESKYTSTGIPWLLIWSTEKTTLKEALVLEKKLKNLTQLRKIKFIKKYSDGIQDKDLVAKIERKYEVRDA